MLINGQFTEEFDIESGVPQGSVLSPFLYAVYINGLHKVLREANLGVCMCGRRVPLLLYADDIVLLARTDAELKAMLKVVYEYAHRWRFDINHGKSNVVVVGSKKEKEEAREMEWKLGEKVLEVRETYKYLGAETGKTGQGR